MIEFFPLKADLEERAFVNAQHIPFVLDLLLKYKQVLVDDSMPSDDGQLLDFVINMINRIYPYFVVCVINDEPVGCAWITHWHKGKKDYHSCQIHGCVDKKFWGKKALYALKALIKYLHKSSGAVRFQVEIEESNEKAINYVKRAGFLEEGLLKYASQKNGMPVNHVLLAKIVLNET